MVIGKRIKPRAVYVMSLFFVGLVLHGSALSGSPLSGSAELVELILEALEGNHRLKAREEVVAGLREARVSAGSLADPRLGVALLNLPALSLDFTREPMTQKQVFISQRFPWPGKLGLKSRLVMAEAYKQEKLLADEILITAKGVAKLYYDLGFVARNIALNKQLEELVTLLIDVAAARYASGAGTRQDVFQARVERSRLLDERVNLRRKYRIIEKEMHVLLNRTVFSPVPPPAVPDVASIGKDVSALAEKAVKGNTGLAIREAELGKTLVKLAIAKMDYYPDIDVRLSYGQRDEDRSGRDLDDFISVSASVNLPLWKEKKQDKNVLSVKAQKRSAEHALTAKRIEIPHRADSLAVEITESLRRLKIYRDEIIPDARKWAESSLNDYEVGNTDFASMIRANFLPLRMELEEKRILFGILKKKAELELLAGGAL